MTLRLCFAAVWLASSALAAPPLTTIQDVLYKADGTRFNGTVTISWTGFQAMDNSTIASQSITVKIMDGNLRVQLVPTTTSTPTTYYSATYNSNGRIQFAETWSVPSSAQPLPVRAVRIAIPSNVATAPTAGAVSTPVQESDVVGLIADLGARPLKGPGFAAGRTAVVDALGALESASGSATDCVHVDGSSGPCGGTQPSFVDGDSPAGIVDGSNTSFTLSGVPDPASSLAVYRNGMLQKLVQDYTLAGASTIQFAAADVPQPGDTLLAGYRLTGTDSDTPQMFPSPQVLCSGTGAAISSTSLASIRTCTIPSALLLPGDRVEIRFDFAHQGTASGFSFEIHWGATTILHRDAAAGEALVTGRADAALLASSAQLNSQSWGALLPFNTTVSSATDSYTGGLTIDFRGMVVQTGDTLTLGNFTVVRFP